MNLFWIGIITFITGFTIRYIFQRMYIYEKSKSARDENCTKIKLYKILINIGIAIAIIGLIVNIISAISS